LNFQDNTQALLHLGLTTSEAKVYIALLRLATDSKGITIAKFADVPRQDVYRLLVELQQIGIVQKTIAKPATFRASSPEEAVDILLKKKLGDFSQLKSEADDFVRNAKNLFGSYNTLTTFPCNDQFTLISEREALTYKARVLLEKIEISLNDVTPFSELIPWLTVLSKVLNNAMERGVKVRWITDNSEVLTPFPPYLKKHICSGCFQLRFISNAPNAKMGIYDSKEIILGVHTDSGFACSPALWSNNKSLVSIAESHFEACWKKGKVPKIEMLYPISTT
jgi:sugar-specific transcriptional regulator TrmB